MITSADVRPGTVRRSSAPGLLYYRLASHRAVPGRCQFFVNDPTKRRTGAMEFEVHVLPKFHRVLYDV